MSQASDPLFQLVAEDHQVHGFVFNKATLGYSLYQKPSNVWHSQSLIHFVTQKRIYKNNFLEAFNESLIHQLARINHFDFSTALEIEFRISKAIDCLAKIWLYIHPSGIWVVAYDKLVFSDLSNNEITFGGAAIDLQFQTFSAISQSKSLFFVILESLHSGQISYANQIFHDSFAPTIQATNGKDDFFTCLNTVSQKHLRQLIKMSETAENELLSINLAHINRKGEERHLEWVFINSKFTHNGVIGIGIDRSQMNEDALSIEKERMLYRTILDLAPINIYATDKDGRKIFSNKAELNFVGVKSENEILGRKDGDIFKSLDRDRSKRKDDSVISERKTIAFEGFLSDGNGIQKRLYVSKSPIINSNDEVTGLVGVSIDISRRYEIEQELSRSESKFRFISENISGGILILENGQVVYVSSTYEKIFGHTSEELMQRENDDFFNFVHPDDLPDLKKTIQKVSKKQSSTYHAQYRYKHKAGHYVWREDSVSITYDDTGVRRVIILAIDASERRKEDELQRLIKFSMENTFDGILWINTKGSIHYANTAACDLLGFDRSELIGCGIATIDLAKRGKLWQEYLKEISTKKSMLYTSKFKNRKGGFVDLEVRSNHINFKGEKYVCTFLKDISGKLESENALKRTNEMLKIVSELSEIGGWTLNLLSQKLSWTEVTKRILDVPQDYQPSLEDALGYYIEPAKIRKLFNVAIATGKPWKTDHKIRTAKGVVKWVQSIGNVEIVENRAISVFGSLQDITEKKLVELELEQKNKILEIIAKGTQELLHGNNFTPKLQSLFEKLGAILDVDRIYLFRALYEKNDFKYLSQVLEWCSPSQIPQIDNPALQEIPRAFVEEYLQKLIQGIPYSAKLSEMDSNYLYELFDSQNIKSILIFPILAGDRFWGFVGFDNCRSEKEWKPDIFSILNSFSISLSQAITRKNVEDKVKQSQLLLQKLTENIPGAVFQFRLNADGQSTFPFVSQSIFKLFNGSELKQSLKSLEDAFKFIVPEDVEGLKKSIEKSALAKSQWEYEFRMKLDSEIRWFRASSIPELQNDNSIVWYGYLQDINDKKLKNDALSRLVEITADQNQRLLNFAYIISHNIRSHTSNISSLLNIWQLAADENEQQLYLEMLLKSMERLEKTIFNLNEIITIQREINLPRVELSLRQEVERAVMAVSNDIAKYHAKIDIKIPKDMVVKVVPAYLDSILINLITNALKYRSESRPLEVSITAEKSEKEISLSVRDNGRGIDLEKYGSKIFGLYKTFHGNEDARGVGLFLVKNQIESMKGRIELESTVGMGTTFNIYFNLNE